MFPVHRITDSRMCFAQTIPNPPLNPMKVITNGLLQSVQGHLDTHCDVGALINHQMPVKVLVCGIPIIAAIRDGSSPDIPGCQGVHGQDHPTPAQGSPNVFTGSGTMGAGIGSMLNVTGIGGIFNANMFNVGELVSAGGSVIGKVESFSPQEGNLSGAIHISDLQGAPIGPGTVITGQTSGAQMQMNTYIDSRQYNPYIKDQYQYPSQSSVIGAVTTDEGDYIILNEPYASYEQNTAMQTVTL